MLHLSGTPYNNNLYQFISGEINKIIGGNISIPSIWDKEGIGRVLCRRKSSGKRFSVMLALLFQISAAEGLLA